jgi:hypothetical protein
MQDLPNLRHALLIVTEDISQGGTVLQFEQILCPAHHVLQDPEK